MQTPKPSLEPQQENAGRQDVFEMRLDAIHQQAGEGVSEPACGPINVAGVQNIAPAGRPLGAEDAAPAAAPDIIDIEQDDYARKRGYRNIDELLDNPRRM